MNEDSESLNESFFEKHFMTEWSSNNNSDNDLKWESDDDSNADLKSSSNNNVINITSLSSDDLSNTTDSFKEKIKEHMLKLKENTNRINIIIEAWGEVENIKEVGMSMMQIIKQAMKMKKIYGYCEPFSRNIIMFNELYDYKEIRKIKRYLFGIRSKYFGPDSLININVEQTKKKLATAQHDNDILFGVGSCEGCVKSTIVKDNKDGMRFTPEMIPYNFKIITNKIKIIEGNYTQFSHLEDYIIYCDLTNINQLLFYNDENQEQEFNIEKFIKWSQIMSNKNLIFINFNNKTNWAFNHKNLFINN